MAERQWVNLEKKSKFLTDGITSLDRLGLVSVVVEFGSAGPAEFKVSVEPVGGHAAYSPEEKARNPNFELFVGAPASFKKPGSTQEMIGETIALPAAGGDLYRINACYEGTVVSTPTLETWRRLFYQVLVMAPPPIPDPRRPTAPMSATNLGNLESSYQRYFIDLKLKSGPSWLPFQRNIDPADFFNYQASTVRSAYALKDWEPYSFVAAFAHSLAMPQETSITIAQAQLPAQGTKTWFQRLVNWVNGVRQGIVLKYQVPDRLQLWYGLDDHDDLQNGGQGGWLVPGSARYIDDTGSAFDIPDHCVYLDRSKTDGPLGGYRTIGIAVPPHMEAAFLASRSGRLKMRLRTIKGWALGLAAKNLMLVARMAHFAPVAEKTAEYTANHELGHLVGMTATGGYGETDGPPGTRYGSWACEVSPGGHVGPHCHAGVYWSGSEWIGAPECVMFGANGARTVAGQMAHAPPSYCGVCDPIVKKVDLSKLRCY
jgi:hypothetical protein